MISLFKQFLIKLAVNFLHANNYEICSKGKSVSEIKQRKWFRVKELTPGEMAFLLKIFEGE